MSMDFSEVEALSRSIGRASSGLVDEARKVVFKGAMNVKEGTRSRVSSHPTWRRLAASVDFEQVGLEAEVGYNDVGQGELAGIAEFGSARHAPHPALMPAAREEAPRFEKALLDVAAKIVEDAL